MGIHANLPSPLSPFPTNSIGRAGCRVLESLAVIHFWLPAVAMKPPLSKASILCILCHGKTLRDATLSSGRWLVGEKIPATDSEPVLFILQKAQRAQSIIWEEVRGGFQLVPLEQSVYRSIRANIRDALSIKPLRAPRGITRLAFNIIAI